MISFLVQNLYFAERSTHLNEEHWQVDEVAWWVWTELIFGLYETELSQ